MKAPTIWRKKNGAGKFVGNCFVTIKGVDVNLGTKNHVLATQRRAEAIGKGKRNFLEDADAAAAALDPDVGAAGAADPPTSAGTNSTVAAQAAGFSPLPAPAAPAAPAPTAPPAGVQPDAVLPPGSPQRLLASAGAGGDAGGAGAAADAAAEAEATNAAAAEGSDDDDAAAAVPPKPQVTNKELAMLGVAGQIWVAQQYARTKVWKGYVAPPFPDVAKAALAEEWEKIIAYANIGAILPPWVTGLVIPGVTIIAATATLGAVFAEQAALQKKAAGVQDDKGEGAAAAAAAA